MVGGRCCRWRPLFRGGYLGTWKLVTVDALQQSPPQRPQTFLRPALRIYATVYASSCSFYSSGREALQRNAVSGAVVLGLRTVHRNKPRDMRNTNPMAMRTFCHSDTCRHCSTDLCYWIPVLFFFR